MAMRKGTCKSVRGKRGVKVCRLANGKVRFRRSSGTRGVSGTRGTKGTGTGKLGATRGRKCVRYGRAKNGARVCRKFSTAASRRRNR